MTILDATEAVLRSAGRALRYAEITRCINERGLTRSRPSVDTLRGVVHGDITRRVRYGNRQRFVSQGRAGIRLAADLPDSLLDQIGNRNREVRDQLLSQVQEGSPADFEKLIAELLVQMGFEDVEGTRPNRDGGVDVRGTLVVGEVVRIRMAVQAKRWQANVQAPIVQQLRGSLGAHEQGLIITTSDFSPGACTEAARPDASPVALMNGKQLAVLLAENEIGVQREEHILLTLNEPDEAGG